MLAALASGAELLLGAAMKLMAPVILMRARSRACDRRVKELHNRGWDDVAIVKEVLPPRTWFALGLTLGDLSSLNLVQSALYRLLVRPEVDEVMQRLRQA